MRLCLLPLLVAGFPVYAEGPVVADLVSMVFSLLAVLALILVLAWLVKRFNPALPSSDEFKVIRTLPLGTRERLLVVEIDDAQHLLGVTPGSINYLYQLKQPLTEKELPELAKQFSQFLNSKNKKK